MGRSPKSEPQSCFDWVPVIKDACLLSNLSLHTTTDARPDQQTQKKNYERLQKALDSVMSIREMTQVKSRRITFESLVDGLFSTDFLFAQLLAVALLIRLYNTGLLQK